MPDSLDQSIPIRDQHYVHHNKLVPLAFKTIVNQTAGRDHVVMPRNAPVVNFAGDVNPGTELEIANKYFVGELQELGWMGDDVLFNVAFDPQTRTLTAHEFFDPAGDCGYDGTWVWRDYAFAMVSYRFQGTCDHTQRYPNPIRTCRPSASSAR